jgi:photosystem II stability/assembly factor-like uncharacterized protein
MMNHNYANFMDHVMNISVHLFRIVFLLTVLVSLPRAVLAAGAWEYLGPDENHYVLDLMDDSAGRLFMDAFVTEAGGHETQKFLQCAGAGTNWDVLYPGWPLPDLLFPDPCFISSPSVYFASTEEGVFRTTDAGNTWGPLSLGGWYTFGRRSDGQIVAEGSHGIFTSTDYGDTWTTQSLTLPPGGIGNLQFDAAGRIYGHNSKTVYRSDDNGKTWTSVLSALPPAEEFFSSLAVSPAGHVYISEGDAFGYGPGGYFDRSLDHGLTWTRSWLTFGLGRTVVSQTNEVFAASSDADGNPQILRSLDNGDTWTLFADETSLPPGHPPLAITTMHITPQGILYVGTLYGVYRYTETVPVELSSFTAE